jgi:hypothetical protein
VKWNNALLDRRPKDSQQVLISADGIYYLVHYDAERQLFFFKDDPDIVFNPLKVQIYWISLPDPNASESADTDV